MKKLFTYILSFYCLLFISCADEPNKAIKDPLEENNVILDKNQNLNISFLLDLSDRINPQKYPNESMEYYQRDAAYIKSVAEAFSSHLKSKKVRQMNDKIQVFFDPEPQNPEINKLSSDLKFNITRDNASIELLDEINDIYSSKPLKLYELAILDNKYVGSDTWRFFKNKVKDFCLEDNYRNILIILTDGYIFHKDTKIKEKNQTTYLTPEDIRSFKLTNNKWHERMEKESFGFIPATDNLENLEVLVLGINPDNKNSFEEDVINKYWSDWLKSMNVGRFEIKTTGLPSNMEKVINDFIKK